MIRLALRLRPLLPSVLWQELWSVAWRRFWQRERENQEKLFGMDCPSLRGSERAVLIEHVAACFPCARVLEIGCAYGQNFDLLAPLFPDVSFVGVDKDPSCIEEGRALTHSRGFTNVDFLCADAADLSTFEAGSFDVVYTSAALLYVSPEEIRGVLREALRVAKQQLVLLEQHDANGEERYVARSRGGGGYWLRDYVRLLNELCPSCLVHCARVPTPLWSNEQWREYGTLVVLERPSDRKTSLSRAFGA